MPDEVNPRDIENIVRLAVWGELKQDEKKGTRININGSSYSQDDIAVLNSGYGFNLSKDSDAEVLLLSIGSDVNQTIAIPSIPWKNQRPWRVNTGGIQNPLDPEKAFEFNKTRSHLLDPNFAIGENGILEVKGDTVYIRGNLIIEKDLDIGGDLRVGGKISSEQIDCEDGAFGSLSAGGETVETDDIGREDNVDSPESVPPFEKDE